MSRVALQVIQWPLVQDMDSGQIYVATDVDDTRTQHPRHWHLVEAEPLESMMIRAAVDAGVLEWEADDE